MINRTKLIITTVSASIATVVIVFVCLKYNAATIEVNETIYAIAPEEITSIAYEDDSLHITAKRGQTKDVFEITVSFSDNRTPLHCLTSPATTSALLSFSEIHAHKSLAKSELDLKYTKFLGRLNIIDSIVDEPTAPFSFYKNPIDSSIAATHGDLIFETDLVPEVFSTITTSCVSNH